MVFSLEASIRGVIEKSIDFLLSDENLVRLHQSFEGLKPHIKSKEDALFGFIYGTIIATVSDIYHMALHRRPTSEEFNEAVRLIEARLPLIKSKIMSTFI